MLELFIVVVDGSLDELDDVVDGWMVIVFLIIIIIIMSSSNYYDGDDGDRVPDRLGQSLVGSFAGQLLVGLVARDKRDHCRHGVPVHSVV